MDNLTGTLSTRRSGISVRTPQLREGFAGQDMFVIPRPIIADARRHPLVRPLYPTDIGWYPRARYHYRERLLGAPEDHLMMCLEGHGYVVIDGEQAHLQPGQMLIIPRNHRHKYWAAQDEPWSIYWMHFQGEDADYYTERMPIPGQPAQIDDAARKEAVRLFRDCLDALQSGYTMPTLIYAAESARHILSLLMFRNSALPMEERAESRKARCNAIIEYMHTRLHEPVRLEEFARQAGLSVSHFSEMFREQTGHSPMAHFTQLKIRLACRLLDLTNKPVKAVAAETGYNDPYYFSRVFKKEMGVSPDHYRAITKG